MGDRDEEMWKCPDFTVRRDEYVAQIWLIQSPEARRLAKLRAMEKLVQEFGNDSEKFGIQFGLYPLWADVFLGVGIGDLPCYRDVP